jgi:enoyl-CoA hydratase
MVSYTQTDGVATIGLDDGKVNVLSIATQVALHDALDRAEHDGAAVLLTGRPGVFSAGFDLPVLRAGGTAAAAMVRGGFELAARLLAFPRPIVAACTGHSIAMGTFLLFSCDYRVGAAGEFKLMANEVALGIAFPYSGAVILRSRLTPSAFHRTSLLSEAFSPATAVQAGFLDEVVPADEVTTTALTRARALAELPAESFAASRIRQQSTLVEELRRAIAADAAARQG